MQIVIQLLVSSVVIFAASYVLEGVHIKNFFHAILAAILLAVANVTIEPVLQFIGWPLKYLTLGFSLIAINAIVLMIIDAILPGLKIKSFWWAVGFSIIISIFSSILNWIF